MYNQFGGYGYYCPKQAEDNLKHETDCTERGTFKWITAKSIKNDCPMWVEVTHVVPTHEGAHGKFVATVIEWVR